MIVAIVVVTGCGSKSGTTGAQSTTTLTPVGPTTTAPAATDPAKSAQAKRAVLQQADFVEAGWTTQPEDAGIGLETVWGDITRCLGVQETGLPVGMATSPTFLRGLATQTRSTVEYTSESSAGAIAAAFAGPEFEKCSKEALAADVKRSAPAGGVVGEVQMTALPPPQGLPAAPAQTFADRFAVTMDMQGLKVPINQDFVVVLNGGTIVRTMFLNPGSPFPQELERALLQRLVARA